MITPLLILAAMLAAGDPAPMRPPAVPLVTHDPYFSIWSMSDNLTDSPTKHWTGTDQPLNGLARIDGTTYRFMGDQPRGMAPLKQVAFELTPTRTNYSFEGAGIHLGLTFLTPALPRDLDVLSRPVTYVSFEARSMDGKEHEVAVDFDASPLIATNTPEQKVGLVAGASGWGTGGAAGRHRTDQPVLEKSGDNLRIDWGYFYLAVRRAMKRERACRRAIRRGRASLQIRDDCRKRDELEPVEKVWSSHAVAFGFVRFGASWECSGFIAISDGGV